MLPEGPYYFSLSCASGVFPKQMCNKSNNHKLDLEPLGPLMITGLRTKIPQTVYSIYKFICLHSLTYKPLSHLTGTME